MRPRAHQGAPRRPHGARKLVADLELLDLLLGLRPLLARRGSHLLELLVLLAAGGLEREERLLGRLDLIGSTGLGNALEHS